MEFYFSDENRADFLSNEAANNLLNEYATVYSKGLFGRNEEYEFRIKVYDIVDRVLIGYSNIEEVEEFYEEGLSCLVNCIKIFNPEIGGNFEAFYFNCLRRRMNSVLSKRAGNKYFANYSMTRKRIDKNTNETIEEKNKCDSFNRPINDDDDSMTLGDMYLDSNTSSDNDDEALGELDIDNVSLNMKKYLLSLSPKQLQIARLKADGYSVDEICSIMGISRLRYKKLWENMTKVEMTMNLI